MITSRGGKKYFPMWTHYLSRPMTIFSSSLWHEWYASPHIIPLIGTYMPDAFFIEHPQGTVAHFRKPEQLDQFLSSIQKMIREEPKKMEKLLTEGLSLIDEAKKRIHTYNGTENLQESVDFLVRLGQQSANLPRIVLNTSAKQDTAHTKLIKIAEKIRLQTVYQNFMNKVIIPLATEMLRKEGFKNAEQKIHLLTYKELIEKRFTDLEERISERQGEKLFNYTINGSAEKISFSHKNETTLHELLGSPQSTEHIKGTVAFPGKATGRARIILDKRRVEFSPGDILVSISSSPELMPYLVQCGAIVTDEGGLGCHAAIISRELKKPCIIGTKIATQVFKDGDLIEVDAFTGTVKKI